ncbi:hypothetical protein [Ensifer aridi]|uniref:hypothetical protein n=1 Tax=Ensifer aridi TaxID=1708715 RepID=UPI001FCD767B|nr:hypothetical protein [Ensifer aridi]
MTTETMEASIVAAAAIDAMEFRNAVFIDVNGTRIDMEINHPKYGWVPFTADSNDVEEHSRLLFAEAVERGEVAPYTGPTVDKIRENMRELSARQFRLGLVQSGLSPAQVTAAIETMPEGFDKETAKIEWEYATTFNRLHPLIATVGTALGLTDEQIDAMWTAAVNL